MIRFIHTADIHFGMENYGRIDATSGIHSRLHDFDKAFTMCVNYAIEQQVDFVLFSGDAYKTANPTPTHQKFFLKGLLKLYEHKIPTILILGNHDNPLSYGKAHSLDLFADLPLDGFHVVAKPTIIPLNTKNGPVNIVGIPWPTRNTVTLGAKNIAKSSQQITEYISEAVSRIIQDMASSLDPEIPAVLAAHLTVASGIFSGSEKRAIYGTDPLFMPSQLALSPFDYVALGHLHRYQDLNPNGYPSIIYSGSIERIDFGERKEEKGFCDVTIHAKGTTTHQFVPTPTRPFIQIEAHLSHERQTEDLIAQIAAHPIENAVIKILYHLPPDARDTVNLSAVQKACAQAWYIVGVLPVRKIQPRERRAHLDVDTDFKTMLSNYLDTKPELAKRKQILIDKALELYDEAQEQILEEEEK